MHDQELTT